MDPPPPPSQLSQLLETFAHTSQSSEILSSIAPCTQLEHLNTESQRPADGRNTSGQLSRPPYVVDVDDYKDVVWSRLQWEKVSLESCSNSKGSSTSWIYNYGWRTQQKGVYPPTYFWVCADCHLKKRTDCYAYNITMEQNQQPATWLMSTISIKMG